MSGIKKTINYLDGKASNYGFSQNRAYGLVSEIATASPARKAEIVSEVMLMPKDVQAAVMPQLLANSLAAGSMEGMPNYSINPAIANRTRNKSTFMVTIDVDVTGTGSGNTFDPVFLFGGSSLNNSDTPYLQVQSAGQEITFGTVNGKNVVIFKYQASVGNYTTYTVSLGTQGEYPFILNNLSGENEMRVNAIQTQISDVTKQSQLSSEIYTFEFDSFGKAVTNDLTTPIDLYQQSDSGVFMPHEFNISNKKGMVLDVLNVDGFQVKLYFYATPLGLN